MLRSMRSAFLMYSKIPVPKVEWKEENRRFSLCFFPLVGAVTALLFVLWNLFCHEINASPILSGAGSMLIPVMITGGIHLDGFCDVCDARASWGDRSKKLKIMSDAHIGAFAAINVSVYLIVQTAVFSQITEIGQVIAASFGFVMSRCLSGITAVTFRCAKKDGSLQDFIRPAHKGITLITLAAIFILSSAGMIISAPGPGAFAVAACAIFLLYYRHFSYKNFGGVTGDLSGWFLQMCEIIIPAVLVISELIQETYL